VTWSSAEDDGLTVAATTRPAAGRGDGWNRAGVLSVRLVTLAVESDRLALESTDEAAPAARARARSEGDAATATRSSRAAVEGSRAPEVPVMVTTGDDRGGSSGRSRGRAEAGRRAWT